MYCYKLPVLPTCIFKDIFNNIVGDNEFKNPLDVSATSFDSLALHSPVGVSTPVVGKQTRPLRSTRHSAEKNNRQKDSSQVINTHSERKKKKKSPLLGSTDEKPVLKSKITNKENRKNKLSQQNEEESFRNNFFQSLLKENDSLDVTLDLELPSISPQSNHLSKTNQRKNDNKTENSKQSNNQVSDTTKTTDERNSINLKSDTTCTKNISNSRRQSTHYREESVQNSPAEKNRGLNKKSCLVDEDKDDSVSVINQSITTGNKCFTTTSFILGVKNILFIQAEMN